MVTLSSPIKIVMTYFEKDSNLVRGPNSDHYLALPYSKSADSISGESSRSEPSGNNAYIVLFL